MKKIILGLILCICHTLLYGMEEAPKKVRMTLVETAAQPVGKLLIALYDKQGDGAFEKVAATLPKDVRRTYVFSEMINHLHRADIFVKRLEKLYDLSKKAKEKEQILFKELSKKAEKEAQVFYEEYFKGSAEARQKLFDYLLGNAPLDLAKQLTHLNEEQMLYKDYFTDSFCQEAQVNILKYLMAHAMTKDQLHLAMRLTQLLNEEQLETLETFIYHKLLETVVGGPEGSLVPVHIPEFEKSVYTTIKKILENRLEAFYSKETKQEKAPVFTDESVIHLANDLMNSALNAELLEAILPEFFIGIEPKKRTEILKYIVSVYAPQSRESVGQAITVFMRLFFDGNPRNVANLSIEEKEARAKELILLYEFLIRTYPQSYEFVGRDVKSARVMILSSLEFFTAFMATEVMIDLLKSGRLSEAKRYIDSLPDSLRPNVMRELFGDEQIFAIIKGLPEMNQRERYFAHLTQLFFPYFIVNSRQYSALLKFAIRAHDRLQIKENIFNLITPYINQIADQKEKDQALEWLNEDYQEYVAEKSAKSETGLEELSFLAQ